MGGETVASVAPARAAVLEDVAASRVQIGDLEDLEIAARAGAAQVVIGSSHAVPCARRLGLPVLRAGFPQYDHVGGYQKTWVGYRGTRQTLFDLANLVLEHHGQHEIRPFRSRYATKGDVATAAAAAAAGGSAH